jgi:hypothetical protein
MALEEINEPPLTEYLPASDPVSNLTKLSHNVFIFVDPETRTPVRILAQGPFGMTEYDKAAGRYVVLGDESYDYVYELFNDFVKYTVDWDNQAAFDENEKSLALSKFSDGTLDEEWLKENTIFAGDVSKEE